MNPCSARRWAIEGARHGFDLRIERHSHSTFGCPRKGILRGKNRRLRWRANWKRTQSVVNRMMTRATTTVG